MVDVGPLSKQCSHIGTLEKVYNTDKELVAYLCRRCDKQLSPEELDCFQVAALS
jgi:hypothetical protein